MLKKLLTFSLVCLLFACSSLTGEDGIFRDRKYDYRKAEKMPRMEIPAGLDTQAIVDHYVIPPVSPFAEQENFEKVPLPAGMAGGAEAAVKIQKLGNSQWILLQIPASQVWPRLKEFISMQTLVLGVENGSTGMIEASAKEGLYRFRIEQGFQHNTSEVLVRFLTDTAEQPEFWPASSSDVAMEQAMVEQLAQFFSDVSEKPAYSFAAQGISTQKKLTVDSREDGTRFLLLAVGRQRALATISQSLKRCGFLVESADSEQGIFTVQYAPPLAEEDQPGFFMRLIGFSRKPYDDEALYAGNRYLFAVTGFGSMQRVDVQAMQPVEDPVLLRQELNQQLYLLKGHLF